MLKTIIALTAITMALSFAPTAPAFATDGATAVKLCEKNPNCSYSHKKEGGVLLWVGRNAIDCPVEGECTCFCEHRSAPRNSAKGLTAILAGRK